MDGSSSKRRRTGLGSAKEVTDAEVEEFYAILRRIRMAPKLSCATNSPPAAWSSSFAHEDFQAPKDDASEVQSGHPAPPVPERRPLDLNADPEPESTLGPTTA
jgi:hypothetical protein